MGLTWVADVNCATDIKVALTAKHETEPRGRTRVMVSDSTALTIEHCLVGSDFDYTENVTRRSLFATGGVNECEVSAAGDGWSRSNCSTRRERSFGSRRRQAAQEDTDSYGDRGLSLRAIRISGPR